MFVEAAMGAYENLYVKNDKTGLYYISSWKRGHLDHKMEELACFTGGTMALAYLHQIGYTNEQNYIFLQMGIGLAETCYQMFHKV